MVARAIYKAREQFLADGHIEHDLETAVSAEVLRSWRRSKLSGARAEVPGLPRALGETAESALTVAAEPVLARLVEQFAGLRAGVLLSDRHANILRRWAPDFQSLEHMDQTCSAVGASGSEAEVGTNGIGTVTEERQARMVVGPEHFAEVFTNHACIGAPIHHPLSRRFEGVVTLSAGVAVASPLLLPLVMGIAREIEQRLLEQSSRKERMLLDAFLSASRRGSAAAVIGEGVFMVGPKASRLLRGFDPSMLWLRLRDEIPGVVPMASVVLDAPEGVVRLTCEPLSLDGRLVGAILDVGPGIDLSLRPRRRDPTPAAGRVGPPPRPAPGWSVGQKALPGRSVPWAEALGAAAAQVGQRTPLVVFGEPGTGKLSLVRVIHGAAGHADDAFTVVDCAAATVPAGLLAASDHPSRSAGTIVLHHLDGLDEAGAASLVTAVERLCARRGPRVVATTTSGAGPGLSGPHRHLFDELAVGRIELPALRQRSEDIPELVGHLLARHGAPSMPVSTKAMTALQRAPWPGNVRQLEAIVRGLVAAGTGREVTVEMLPVEVRSYSRRRPLTPMEQLELDAILLALRRTGGNKVVAARALGISRSTLYRKMTSYQLDPERNFF